MKKSPLAMKDSDRKNHIDACLDEIKVALQLIDKNTSDGVRCRVLESWIRKQKELLKKLNYTGKVPRKTRKVKNESTNP